MELRRFTRAPIRQPVLFAPKDGESEQTSARSTPQEEAFVEGVAVDISLGGMFITSERPVPFGVEITVYTTLEGARGEFVLPGIVRWTRPDGMGVQFQLLGARETFAITEIVRRHEESR